MKLMHNVLPPWSLHVSPTGGQETHGTRCFISSSFACWRFFFFFILKNFYGMLLLLFIAEVIMEKMKMLGVLQLLMFVVLRFEEQEFSVEE